jgi:hypothetical protein
MPNENKRKSFKFLSETILLFIIPIYAYLILYLYEWGYFNKLSIPDSFIEVNLPDILKIAIFLPFIFFIYIALELIRLGKLFENPIRKRIVGTIFYLLFIVLALYFLGLWKWYLISIVLFFTLLDMYLFFIHPLIIGKNIHGYKEKMFYQSEAFFKSDFLIVRLLKKFGLSFVSLVFIIIEIMCLSVCIGIFVARTQKTFMVIKSSPELIILRKYSQNIVCCEYDREKKEIIKNFYIKTIDQISREGIRISIEEIGPLKAPKKEKNKLEKNKMNDKKGEKKADSPNSPTLK